MYKLDNRFAQGYFTVTIIGCGGTGSFAADGLCRLLPSNAVLTLIDHDRVEEANISRQNFTKEDLGRFKSEALAQRLSSKYDRSIAYSTNPVALCEIKMPGVVVGCVDNGFARREITKKVKNALTPGYGYTSWLVDAGNGNNFGQILIGNCGSGGFIDEICHGLPLPAIQMPDILLQAPPQQPGCLEIAEQGPTINQVMAALIVEVVRRLIEGTCSWMQLYIDLDSGTLSPVFATPEIVERITGIKKRKLERR